MGYTDPSYQQKYQQKYRLGNKERRKEYQTVYYEELKKHAYESLITGEIINQRKWKLWCTIIKSNNKNKQTYSEDFTNVVMFEKLSQGCFYCGCIAMTIDRINSSIGHTPENCVGCCQGCNYSKGTADISTFIRKAYYRARRVYIDDNTDIWFKNKKKPYRCEYKKHANNKGVPFDLTEEDWKSLIKGNCEYCHRTPTTWFGIDRVIPEKGYVTDNVVTCCFDCNLDKHIDDVDTVTMRNELIACRVDAGELVINNCDQVIIHCGTNKKSKKVCVYGKIYENCAEASRELGKRNAYVGECIRRGTHPNDIFAVTDDLYNE